MIYPLEQLKGQINKTEHQLLYYLIQEQQETNRLLRLITENNETDVIDFESMRRQDLMKEMAKLSEKPKGWNKWETSKMVEHLKGVS